MRRNAYYCETGSQSYTVHANNMEDAVRYLMESVSVAELAESGGVLEVRAVPASGIRFKVDGGHFTAVG